MCAQCGPLWYESLWPITELAHSSASTYTAGVRPDFPFDPKKSPVFYGWVIVAAAALGTICSIPGQTTGVSAFTDHLIRATGLSRWELSNTYLAGTVVSGLLLPKGGALLDRLGARRMILLACAGLAATLLYLSVSDHLAGYVADKLGTSSALPGLVAMMLGFTALRFSGQGMMMVISRNLIAKWFDRRRGLATSITSPFISVSFNGAPLVLSLLIDAVSWRGAWQVLAVTIGIGMGIVGWLFYRDNPEECGLSMDGGAAAGAIRPRQSTAVYDASRNEPAWTLAFWTPTLALASHGLILTAVTFHLVDLGSSVGLDRAASTALLLPVSVIGVITSFAAGFAADRFDPRHLVIVMMTFLAVAIVGLSHLGTPAFYWVTVAGLGLSGGFFGAISTVSIPYYFGRKHLGAIAGLQMMFIVLATALGPSIFAASRQMLGGYRPALYGCLALPLIVAGLALITRRPSP